MDRRTTLAKFFGQTRSENTAKAAAAPAAFSGLTPYSGPFGYSQAAHLLRRTTFGVTNQAVRQAATDGLDAVMQQLFQLPALLPPPPVYINFSDDPCADNGTTWVQAPFRPNVTGMRANRDLSLKSWTLQLIHREGVNIREKMVLFWHNHFPVADVNDTRAVYNYSQLVRNYAVGNFRELTKEMTINPAMLQYLNGNDNTAASPNENYARELLELFTIGKGPLVGPGDYTNYTEQDVVEMAKVLTGWRDTATPPVLDPPNDCPIQTVQGTFFNNRHNATTKQLSARFNDVQIPNMGNQEYAHLIDIIFSKDECARFICRKLYRWFVYYEIPQLIEDEVIAPMAQILVDNDYVIQPALEALLRSEHFFDILNVGPMIKNPVDFVMGVVKNFAVDTVNASDMAQLQVYQVLMGQRINRMQMPYYDPPSVAGWKAYYQEPVFYRHWISSVTLRERQTYTDNMLGNGIQYTDLANAQKAFKIDSLIVLNSLDAPESADAVIDELVSFLFPQPITANQHSSLKADLLGTQNDAGWTTLYNNYLSDPTNTNVSNNLKNRMNNLLKAMLKMPEFYLS